VFDSTLPRGFASVTAGQAVEIYGFLNPATNTFKASLVELQSQPRNYKISGLVDNLQLAAKTLRIGQETISLASLSSADLASLANGALVRLRLQPSAPGAAGVWIATRLRGNQDTPPRDSAQAKLEGLITAFASPILFTVNGVPVDASRASFTNGTASLALGAQVEVKGALVSGTLQAREVELERSSGKDITLAGQISGLNTNAKTFELRNSTVNYSAALPFENGSESQLSGPAPVSVEVKGQLDPGGTSINATRLKFKN
jgi:hypothetical protein